jgi:ADP-ribosylglycohydrolase
MPAGTVTDDTEQAVLLARLLVKGHGTINPHELATALTEWEQDMAERGSLDLLGPSTKRAVAAILAGTPPEEAGTAGTTNGAAMRIAPVGIAVPLDPPPPLGPAPPLDPAPPLGPAPPLDPAPPLGPAPPPSQVDLSTLVDRVVAASRVTHNTGIALAGAAAVAAAVSAGVSGATIAEATALGIEAAHIAAGCGHWVAGADVAARIEWATGLVAGRTEAEAAELIYTLAGTSLATQESVPAAFAVLAAVPEDPWRAARLAASLGGDCDTIAAMAGAISGACHGVGSFPSEAIAVIDAQGLGLVALAGELLALRGRPGSRDRPGRQAR